MSSTDKVCLLHPPMQNDVRLREQYIRRESLLNSTKKSVNYYRSQQYVAEEVVESCAITNKSFYQTKYFWTSQNRSIGARL